MAEGLSMVRMVYNLIYTYECVYRCVCTCAHMYGGCIAKKQLLMFVSSSASEVVKSETRL